MLNKLRAVTARFRYFRPGQTAPVSGQYAIYRRGERLKGRQITMVKGKTFPPVANMIGVAYRLTDPTLHDDAE